MEDSAELDGGTTGDKGAPPRIQCRGAGKSGAAVEGHAEVDVGVAGGGDEANADDDVVECCDGEDDDGAAGASIAEVLLRTH